MNRRETDLILCIALCVRFHSSRECPIIYFYRYVVSYFEIIECLHFLYKRIEPLNKTETDIFF